MEPLLASESSVYDWILLAGVSVLTVVLTWMESR